MCAADDEWRRSSSLVWGCGLGLGLGRIAYSGCAGGRRRTGAEVKCAESARVRTAAAEAAAAATHAPGSARCAQAQGLFFTVIFSFIFFIRARQGRLSEHAAQAHSASDSAACSCPCPCPCSCCCAGLGARLLLTLCSSTGGPAPKLCSPRHIRRRAPFLPRHAPRRAARLRHPGLLGGPFLRRRCVWHPVRVARLRGRHAAPALCAVLGPDRRRSSALRL